ncbi:hypothetical protein W97_03558 [Coniosporium apollinis CBS 100218]|uniref:Uncharacterized protein n=1 Tax=Coniosporium apollinis (strain CBS 100218) TaxID=1168221 RepID=R7YQY5_CONA1|nr:uncharacterized protein W97_03558 [Coniosporium apollinis CBS 100218]EON64327.1 hypothetical protein W97_03558 [Coniosporium apollinis CBS 100218]
MPCPGAFAHRSGFSHRLSRVPLVPRYSGTPRCLHHGKPSQAQFAIRRVPHNLKLESTEDKRQIAAKAIQERITRLQHTSTDVDSLNRLSLTGLALLPADYHNPYYFETWIKKLAALKSPDSASQVLEIMYERGIQPNVRQLNALIGAWFRVKGEEDSIKAERIARAMIYRRAALSRRRDGDEDTRPALLALPSLPMKTEEGKYIQRFLRRTLPPASPRTYLYLIKFCLKRGRWREVARYRRLLLRAGFPISTKLSNSLVFAEMYNKRYKRAWIKYRNMAAPNRHPAVEPPDLFTHTMLWQCCKYFLDTTKPSFMERFPPPRRLMLELLSWFRGLTGRSRQRAIRDLQREHAKEKFFPLVAQCFSRASDLPGLLVALYIMGTHLGIAPSKGIANVAVGMVAYIGLPSRTPKMRRITRQTAVYKQRVTKLAAALQAERDRRKQVVYDVATGENKEVEADRVELEAVSEILRLVMSRKADPTTVQSAVDQAKAEMGLGEHLDG